MDSYENSKKNTKRHKKLIELLKMVYGFQNYKPKQYEIINRIISGEDVCAILPTGYGKSLTYQIPALYLDKPAIIVAPLISLMDDQRIILDKLGISSCCYNSNVRNKAEMRKDIMACKYKFIYITPEAITKMEKFLTDLEMVQGISLVAIDEAHCISAYGFDFRKSYRELNKIKQCIPDVPILAVTATATKNVGDDICKVLNLNTRNCIKTSFDRPNLFLEVRKKTTSMERDILPIINKHLGESIIIYCLKKKETTKVAEMLRESGTECRTYHADLTSEERSNAHKDFLSNKINVIAATIAFGMGINKPDIRAIIHYGSPRNIEGYYQEIGRAGRDGKEAHCYALFNMRDFDIQLGFISDIEDRNHREVRTKLLEKMRKFMISKGCRRKILLEYFGDEPDDTCDFCDNCCGIHTNLGPSLSRQNIHLEAKMLIDLMGSMRYRHLGIGTYISILRKSAKKSISAEMKKNKFYGKGIHKSEAWWKEMVDNLISLDFLEQACVKGRSGFPMKIIRVTDEGAKWASMIQLGDILGCLHNDKLDEVEMVTVV